MKYCSTRQVAKILGIPTSTLTKAIWDNRVPSPAKAPSGSFLWTPEDIEKASWALLRRSSGLLENGVA